MTFEPGQTIDQRFLVKQRLGGNTHGSTYKAVSLLSDKMFVLKKLNHDPGQGMQNQLQRAQQAQSLSQSCDQLMTIQEVSVEEDQVFYVLPFLPARSLKRFPPPTATEQKDDIVYFAEDFEWLTRVSQALDFLANQNTVHGDVKPTNVLFDRDTNETLTAFLSDIEIPKPKDGSKKGTDEYSGTMAYLAREVFLDPNAASAQSDQYSLAVTLYQWLSGELPFKGVTGIEMYNAFKKGEIPITDHCPRLPQSVADAIHRGLSEQPENRFASSGEFAAAILADLPSRTKTRQFHWQFIAGLAVLTLLAFLGGQFLAPANQKIVEGSSKQVLPANNLGAGATAVSPIPQTPNGPSPPALQNSNTAPDKTAASSQSVDSGGIAEAKPSEKQDWQSERSSLRPTVDQPARTAEEPSQRESFEELFREALANQRDPELRYQLALAYEAGQGVEANIAQALEHFQAAANQNHAKAQFRLAQYYEQAADDLAPEANYTSALNWYVKAAEQGLPEAQFRIGQYHEQDGSRQGLIKAFQWYAKAANQERPEYSRYLSQFCIKYGNEKLGEKWSRIAQQQERKQKTVDQPKRYELYRAPTTDTGNSGDSSWSQKRSYPNH